MASIPGLERSAKEGNGKKKKKKKKEGNGNPLQPEESGRLYVVHGVTKEMDET